MSPNDEKLLRSELDELRKFKAKVLHMRRCQKAFFSTGDRAVALPNAKAAERAVDEDLSPNPTLFR